MEETCRVVDVRRETEFLLSGKKKRKGDIFVKKLKLLKAGEMGYGKHEEKIEETTKLGATQRNDVEN